MVSSFPSKNNEWRGGCRAVLGNTSLLLRKAHRCPENTCGRSLSPSDTPKGAEQQPPWAQMVLNISRPNPAQRSVYNLAIKIHHQLNFGFYALCQVGIFLYTFIWFQIGLGRDHKHSETPWFLRCFQNNLGFRNEIRLGSIWKQNRKRTGTILDGIFWVRREALWSWNPSYCTESASLALAVGDQQGPQNRKGESPSLGNTGRVGYALRQGRCFHVEALGCVIYPRSTLCEPGFGSVQSVGSKRPQGGWT